MPSDSVPPLTSGVPHSDRPSTGRRDNDGAPHDRTTEQEVAEDLLELLGDEYTRKVLEAVVEQPLSGREVAETTSVSKPTAFRRLNALEAAGLVTAEMVIDADGHHYKEYRAVLQTFTFELGPDGFDIEVEREPNHTTVAPPGLLTADD